MKKNDLILEALRTVEEIFFVMREYDSMQHVYADNKLYQTEAHMIEQIGDNPGISASELAVIFSKTASACSQIIKKLLQKKLITQRHMPENARVHELYLTEEGKKIYLDHNRLENYCYERDVNELADISVQEIEHFLKTGRRLYKCFLLDLDEQKKKLQLYDEKDKKRGQ